MPRLGLGLGLASHRRAGGSVFVPMTKPAAEGDSITVNGNSGISKWLADNFPSSSQNFAIGGSSLGSPPDSANPSGLTMFARLPSVISYNPSDLIVAIGANDLDDPAWDETAWKANYVTYWANARSGASNLKRIFVGEIHPRGPATATNSTQFNTRRASINAWLRGLVGTVIDGIIQYGTHPVLGPDSAAVTSLYDAANLHPTTSGQAIQRLIVNAVLDPVVAQATGGTPSAFSFQDVSNAAISTAYSATNAFVTGMGVGRTATGSVSGAGMFARGTSAFGTSDLTFMNGDVPVPKHTSSGSYTTAVNTTVTIGSRSDVFTSTTAANVTPVGYSTVAGQQANAGFASSYTFSAFTVVAGRFFFLVYGSSDANRLPGAVKFTISGTDYNAVKIATTGQTAWWFVDLPAGSATPQFSSPTTAFAHLGFLGITATNCTTSSSTQTKSSGYYNNPVDFNASQPVNTNELGLIGTITEVALGARNDSATNRSTLSFTDAFGGDVVMTLATLAATGTPSINLGGTSQILFGGYALTAAP